MELLHLLLIYPITGPLMNAYYALWRPQLIALLMFNTCEQ